MGLAVTPPISLTDRMPDEPKDDRNLLRRAYDAIVSHIRHLLDLKDQPHAIAGGVAIGMFMGFTPLFGLKTLLSLGLALALRCNPIAAVVAVSLHDVVTPIWPFLLIVEYKIGFWLLTPQHIFTPTVLDHHLHITEIMRWSSFRTIGLPVLLGSVFLSIPAALISYFAMLAILRARSRRRARREQINS
jgi:uncharacterized protein (DUF2062 family)